MAGVNLDDQDAVASYCAGVRLDTIVRANDRQVLETLVAIGSVIFSKPCLESVGAMTPKVARVPKVRTLVNNTLRRICEAGRKVVLGRDMGAVVFPHTPYQFFFEAPASIREARDSGNSANQAVAQRDASDARQTLTPDGAAIIDTGSKTPEEVLVAILTEVINRTPG